MKRDELKSLIKECLIEILAEGLSSKPATTNVNVKRNIVTSSTRNNQNQVTPQKNLELKQQKLNNISSQKSSHNNIMSAIFEDTMRNTLPKMNKAEANHFRQDYHNGNILLDNAPTYINQEKIKSKEMTAEELVESSMPEDLFGEETSEKWSKIAFNDLNK